MDPPPPYTPLAGDGEETSPNSHVQYHLHHQQQYQPSPPRPPLPPRSTNTTTPSLLSPSPYQPSAWSQQSTPDPRSASQVSLVPVVDATKRKLLVIYIHGFMGNETSFQSFPAHLHNLLCVTLDPLGYLVHTKVYPKFKTRHNILVAAENFSQWLSQFENDNTDVVLLGHSMGGLLAADVALLQDYTGQRRHRILGTISFDTPFLGMHPGVISAGLGSIFRPGPKSPVEEAEGPYQNGGEGSSQSTTSLHTVSSGGSQVDEFFSKKPQRNFTVTVPKKGGTWDGTLHFINKYHSRLTQATGQYLMSHLEFGGCLADPKGLKNRYTTARALEDGIQNRNGGVDRVRFVNYYTSSTGRTKEALVPAPVAAPIMQEFDGNTNFVPGSELHQVPIGDLKLGAASPGHRRNASASSYNTTSSKADMEHIPADPMSDDDGYCSEPPALHIIEMDDPLVVDGRPPSGIYANEKIPFDEVTSEKPSIEITRQDTAGSDEPEEPQLAPIPPPPEEPPTFDYSQIPDPAVRKVAEKEAAKVWKRYEKAVKDHAKAIRDREKAIEKMEKRKGKVVDRVMREAERRKERQEREIERELRQKEKDMEQMERERDRDREQEEREKERQVQEAERERERKEREKRRSLCRRGNTQEKQELERLRKEQERMDAEYRRMNGIVEPPKPATRSSYQSSSPRQPSSPCKYTAPPSPRQPPAPPSPRHLPPPPAQPVTPSPNSTPSPLHKLKKRREHRFCLLPNDKNDKCWVKVEMKGVDEVGAHCGLFFVGEVYERLVGDVAARIEEWVGEETSRRVAEE